MDQSDPKAIHAIPIPPPPAEQRVSRNARFTADGEKKTRYSLPDQLNSASPIGYRKRISLTVPEAQDALRLLSMQRPTAFEEPVWQSSLPFLYH